MSFHSFNSVFAEKYGIHEAIIMNYIYYWCCHNKDNAHNFFEGKTWMYQSIAAFENIFPYMTTSKIRNAINTLVSKGFILKGNFNKSKYDRTVWYAISEKGFVEYKACVKIDNPNEAPKIEVDNRAISICQNSQMEVIENNEPIPLSNHLENNSININSPSEVSKETIPDYNSIKPERKKTSTSSEKKSSSKFKKDDYDSVYKIYFDNCKKLYEFGLISKEAPVVNYPVVQKLLKKRFEEYGIDNVKNAITISLNDKWIIEHGYELHIILGPNKIVSLINGNIEKQGTITKSNSKTSYFQKIENDGNYEQNW